MPRIEDIGVFNAVREPGWRNWCPQSADRHWHGTCGRGNGAEGLYHAFVEVLERSAPICISQRWLLRPCCWSRW